MKILLVALVLLTPCIGRAQPAEHLQHLLPAQPGQSAFAAIQEIVTILEANPRTDWAQVDLEALRRHLADMDNVTLRAASAAEPIDGGARFTLTGEGPVGDSIRRMTNAHAATMNGSGSWTFQATDVANGSILTVTANDADDVIKLRSLGPIGILTRGMHHMSHHLAIAAGGHPH